MRVLTAKQLSFCLLTALTPAPSALPGLQLPTPLAESPDRGALPPHLFIETLRAPFGEDWGGEMFLYTPIAHRLSLGVFMRAWNDAICVSPSCTDRAIEGGVELRYQVKPGVDFGFGFGVQRTAGPRSTPAVLPRVHLKF